MVERVCGEVGDLDPRFIWVGGKAPVGFDSWSASSGLGDLVTFVDSVPNPYPYIAAFDVFTLTSRVDQFPLVVLEAMHLQRPVVAFGVSDDIVEAIGDTGRVVPPEDVAKASEEVVALLRDPLGAKMVGEHAAFRAREVYGIDSFAAIVRDLADSTAGVKA
jgi:glycosyltransferase involved in cell wall biosynthesis